MKAFQLVKYGPANEAFVLNKMSKPALQGRDVLIEVEAFGLNFADVLARNGLYREAPPLPYTPGYDAVGRVVETAHSDDQHLIGKRVAALTRFGGYAQWCISQPNGLVEISDEMPAAVACALGTQYATAYYAACYLLNVREGERVLVHAATGGVGTALIQLLRSRGCIIYATAGSDEKVDLLRAQGIKAFNYSKTDYALEIEKELSGERLDISFNSIAGSTFKKDLKLLGAGGRLVLYGFAERSGKTGGKWATLSLLWRMRLMMPILLMANSKSVIGVNMLKIADHRQHVIGHCLAALVELWKQGIIQPVIGGEYTADQLAEAHEALENRKIIGKAVVKW